MRKNGFTIIEISVVFLLILGTLFIFLPKGIESTKQAKLISAWTQKYSDIQYMFGVMKTQMNVDDSFSMNNFRESVRTHLRITKPLEKPYEPSLKTGLKLDNTSLYKADKYYETVNGELVGFKWKDKNCQRDELCAVMTFDLNGVEMPNIFGRDIFGVNIYKDRVEAFGEEISDTKDLKKYCDSTGIDCSYYYLIGGRFD